MNAPPGPGLLKVWFRRVRTLLWTALSLVILLAAIVVGVGKLLMPYSAKYEPQLEAWLSREFNQPVKVDAFTGEWKAFGPRISLEGLNLLGAPGDAQAIAIRQAALDIKPLNAIIAGRPLYSFRIIGADLELLVADDGRMELSGLGVTGRPGTRDEPGDQDPPMGSGLGNLARVGEVRLEESRLRFFDREREIELQLSELNARLSMNGKALAAELYASMTDLAGGTVMGDLGATVKLELDEANRLVTASWHVDAGEWLLAGLAGQFPAHELKPTSGRVNAELWGEWTRGEAQTMEGVLDVRDLAFASDPRALRVERLNSLFKWRFHDKRKWRIDLADLEIRENGREWGSENLSVERHIAENLGMWVSADYLDVQFPLALTQRILSSTKGRWPANMPTDGGGRVRDFDIVFNADKKLVAVSGQAGDLDIYEWGRWPQIKGLAADVSLAWGEGQARVQGDAVEVVWPRNFRQPLVLDVPDCTLEILWGQSWQIDAQGCELLAPFGQVSGRAMFSGNTGKPAVDINVTGDRIDVASVKPYWPASVIKPAVLGWLERSLIQGTASQLRFSLVGDMDQFPFRGAEGSLEAGFVLNDARFDYSPGWPAADEVNLSGRFEGSGMRLDGSIGSLAGVRVDSAQAAISDFGAARLVIDYRTQALLPQFEGFIAQSPILANSNLNLEDFSFSGPAKTSGSLSIPLGSTPGELGLEGRLEFNNSIFRELRSGFELTAVDGGLEYTRDGFDTAALSANYQDWPVELQLQAEWGTAQPFTASLNGRLPAELVLSESPLAGDLLLSGISGESDWAATLTVQNVPADKPVSAEPEAAVGQTQPNDRDDSPGAEIATAPGADGAATVPDGFVPETWLTLSSSLAGVDLGLPPPLDKPVDDVWPLRLRLPIKAPSPIFTARIDGRLIAQVETDAVTGALVRGQVHLGGDDGAMPPPGFFSLGGEAPQLDLDAWLDRLIIYFGPDRPAAQLQLSEAELQAQELLLLNRPFQQVRMSLERRDDILEAWFESEDLQGTVRYSRNDNGAHSLWMDMERMLLPDPREQALEIETNPSLYPEIHLYAEQFRYLGLDLGATRIEAYPVANGLHIESVRSESENLNFQARGDWLNDADGNRSDFDVVITSESLGNLVNAMDLSSVLEGGQTMVRYNAWWPGPPAAFALSQLNGEMTFSVIDGQILNADPGAGRMLGLFSVAALPRRLAFDFRDVFASGFNFDKAGGTIQLTDGIARTDDVLIESTAAQLSVTGTSNLATMEMDYEVSVRPGVSQALPVIGAIAAGPGGAAAGLALQGLLRKSLGDAAQARYLIQGPWSEPEVTRLVDPPTPSTPQSQGQDVAQTEETVP